MANVVSQAETAIKKEYGWVEAQIALHPKVTFFVGLALIVASNILGVVKHI